MQDSAARTGRRNFSPAPCRRLLSGRTAAARASAESQQSLRFLRAHGPVRRPPVGCRCLRTVSPRAQGFLDGWLPPPVRVIQPPAPLAGSGSSACRNASARHGGQPIGLPRRGKPAAQARRHREPHPRPTRSRISPAQKRALDVKHAATWAMSPESPATAGARCDGFWPERSNLRPAARRANASAAAAARCARRCYNIRRLLDGRAWRCG